MASREHVTDLIPAYALDCLDETETLQVAGHLADCAACRAELEAYQGIVDQLALAVPLTEPPARLKGKLSRRLQPRQPGAGPGWPDRIKPRAASLWPVAALVVVVALLASNLLLWRSLRQISRQPSPGLPAVQLSGTDAAPGASGVIVLSADGEYGTLVVDRLPPLSPDQQYQLWLIEAGQRTSGGLLTVGEDGYGALWVSAAQPLASYDAFGVTIEPAGGSPGPTGPRVLGGAH